MVRPQLEMNFKNADFGQQGHVAKDDFTNIVFEASKDFLLPAQTLAIVNHFTSFADTVNYIYFLQADKS